MDRRGAGFGAAMGSGFLTRCSGYSAAGSGYPWKLRHFSHHFRDSFFGSGLLAQTSGLLENVRHSPRIVRDKNLSTLIRYLQ